MRNHESVGKVWVVCDNDGYVKVFQSEEDAETHYDGLENPYKQMNEHDIWVNVDHED